MECTQQTEVAQWTEGKGNRRRLLGKHIVETPQVGALGSSLASPPLAHPEGAHAAGGSGGPDSHGAAKAASDKAARCVNSQI